MSCPASGWPIPPTSSYPCPSFALCWFLLVCSFCFPLYMGIKSNFSCCFKALVYESFLPCHLWNLLFQDSLLVHLGPKITQQKEWCYLFVQSHFTVDDVFHFNKMMKYFTGSPWFPTSPGGPWSPSSPCWAAHSSYVKICFAFCSAFLKIVLVLPCVLVFQAHPIHL